MKGISSLLLMVLCHCLAAQPASNTASDRLVIPAGITVKVVLQESAEQIKSSPLRIGQVIEFRVVEAVVLEGKTLISEGARAQGALYAVDEPDTTGNMAAWFEWEYVQAVDGKAVLLDKGIRPLVLKEDFTWYAKTRYKTTLTMPISSSSLSLAPNN